MSQTSAYTSRSKPAQPHAAQASASVRDILGKLEKLIGVAARRAGWSDNDVESMVRHASLSYFSGLARGESSEQALTRALIGAERTRSIEFIEQSGSDLRARVGALTVLLERQLDPSVPAQRAIMEASLQAFTGALRAGQTLESAFDVARSASRTRARAVPA